LNLELKLDIAITNCWELTQDRLLVSALLANRDNYKYEEGTKLWIVLDVATGQLSPFSFKLPKEMTELTIDTFSMGMCSVIPTFRFEEGKAKKSPIFYIDNCTEELMFEEEWCCSHEVKWFPSGYEKDVVYQCKYDNGDIHEIVVVRKLMANARLLGVHFLSSVFPDIDYNLLEQTVDFLPTYGAKDK
jgi:hypothetical protein